VQVGPTEQGQIAQQHAHEQLAQHGGKPQTDGHIARELGAQEHEDKRDQHRRDSVGTMACGGEHEGS
jgi:hypothetical protein